MNQSVLIGLSLIAVAAFHLIPAYFTGEIPSRWPFYPLTRTSRPIRYRITIGTFVIGAVAGVCILVAHAAHIASL